GTMLYYRALEQGLSTLPSADEALRQVLEQELKEKGVQYMHERLAAIDPESAARIHPNDPQRITRAIEVYELSGKPMSVWWAEQQTQSFPYPLLKIGIAPLERATLHKRIAKRFEQMLQQGFVDEVKQLRENPTLNLDLPSMRCVGYRQIWQYLDGDFDYETMKDKGIAATRQLAKRQLTWMRGEKNLVLFDSEAPDLLDRVWKSIEAMDFN
ncbi:MAG: tRNA (adenosine(37)-N6)-dimethylallyltransferase MiaA, partial [Gammaproteobacteria bacterium]|nr:tRNA (adenosine(37)-N6)-dimethylallyltransferase MiaA [Gammaproteobacteria bacterium]